MLSFCLFENFAHVPHMNNSELIQMQPSRVTVQMENCLEMAS